MTNSKVNLLGLSRKMLRDYLLSIGEKPFRGDQIMKWIYHAGASDFSEMTDVSKALRERLPDLAEIRAPEVIREQKSRDGTIKWALDVGDGQAVETVYIPEDDRATLCISTQVGCPMGCRFCSTGLQGFNRNLTAAEIVGQVHRLPGGHVVFHGLGAREGIADEQPAFVEIGAAVPRTAGGEHQAERQGGAGFLQLQHKCV